MANLQYDTTRMEEDMALRGWTGPDLARVAGVSRMTVNRVLRGERSNPRTMEKLARALGFSVRRYLMRRKVA